MQSDGSDLLLGIKREKQVKNCKKDKKIQILLSEWLFFWEQKSEMLMVAL